MDLFYLYKARGNEKKFGGFKNSLYICTRNRCRNMDNADFWTSVHTIIAEGFTSEGLHKLDSYAEGSD